ncbi:MAG TPA: carbohydrate kinase family protein [Candidatus Peribacteraceae bacterium]|nr:carbohydrate kinase family protein [Candidatus Peribacteraceae bacterium]
MARKRTLSIGGATYDLFVGTDLAATSLTKDAKDSEATEDLEEQKISSESSVSSGSSESSHVIALPLGEKVHVSSVQETCGGGASNTSVGLSRLGCDAAFAGVIGDDQWGRRLRENMEHEGVDTRGATIVEGEMTSFSIILSARSGERVILYTPGTNTHLQDATFQREQMEDVDWVYLNHIQEQSRAIQDDIIAFLLAHPEQRFTWNPGGPQLEAGLSDKHQAELLKHTDLLLLNKEEAFQFSRTASIQEALRTLSATGAHVVCITDGKHGSYATDGKHLFACPIVAGVNVVETTGAGDAFGVGMTWGLLQGLDLRQSLQAGSISAAGVVSAVGAQAGLLTDTDMKDQLQTVSLEVSVTPLT